MNYKNVAKFNVKKITTNVCPTPLSSVIQTKQRRVIKGKGIIEHIKYQIQKNDYNNVQGKNERQFFRQNLNPPSGSHAVAWADISGIRAQTFTRGLYIEMQDRNASN